MYFQASIWIKIFHMMHFLECYGRSCHLKFIPICIRGLNNCWKLKKDRKDKIAKNFVLVASVQLATSYLFKALIFTSASLAGTSTSTFSVPWLLGL